VIQENQLSLVFRRCKPRTLRELFKKNIDVIEYSEDLATFIRNIFHGFRVLNVRVEAQGRVYVKVDSRDKARVIGKNSCNLRAAKEIAGRLHKVKSIYVL
jgi:NusA-like KH domain protein